ncbi:MAG: hypothetical protein KJ626_15720 [Verrucomicrobia bacterium]|nr:hypothetical protein [Verrucomicrobiota bacterium]
MTAPGQDKGKLVIKRPPSIRIVKRDGKLTTSPAVNMGSGIAVGGRAEAPQHPGVMSPVFAFFCSYCGHRIPSRVDLAGKEVKCPVCAHDVHVPTPLSPQDEQRAEKEREQKAAKLAEHSFKFFCPVCGQKLSATENIVGRKTVCPTCQTKLTIPKPPSYGSAAADSDKFKFFCIYCRQKLEGMKTWIGKNASCPACGNKIVVPPLPPQSERPQ